MSKEIHKNFLRFESDNNLFDLNINNDIPIWQIFRYEIFQKLISNNYKRDPKKIKYILFFFKIIYSHFKLIFCKIDFLHVGSSRKINNQSRDLSFEILKECVGDKNSLVFCETNHLSLSNSYYGFKSLDPFLKFLSSIIIFLNKHERRQIKLIFNKVTSNYQSLDINIQSLYATFNYFKFQYWYYSLILFFKKVKKIFFVKNGMNYGLLYASKKFNKPIYEFQHGDIVSEDVSISFKDINNKNLLIPDVHFTYSNFWIKDIITHSRCIEIGCENNFSDIANSIIDTNGVLVIMDKSFEDYFSRSYALASGSGLDSIPYYPEIEGSAFYKNDFENVLTISQVSNVRAFRLPGISNQAYEIDYTLVSETYRHIRSGTMHVVVDAYGDNVEISDEYHYTGDETYLENIEFNVLLRDADSDLTLDTIDVIVTSTMPTDDETQMKYTVTAKKTNVI